MESPYPQKEILERVATLLEKSTNSIKGKIIDEHVILDIVGAEVHYWSPQLNFRVEVNEGDKNQSLVAGLIGPRPPVWTLFMFIYFLIGVVGFFISSYGVAKLIMGEYSNYILVIPLSILLMLTAYKVGKYGEHLASDQIEILKQFVRDVLNVKKELS
ncbi:MAG: hypothetical protein HKN51_02435 [Saprospiraceae bacterium]|nr:hypothetical protein [Bacteroidia bacterium]NNE13805.1 hypothetical protein [Saprospiraceae bacterium]